MDEAKTARLDKREHNIKHRKTGGVDPSAPPADKDDGRKPGRHGLHNPLSAAAASSSSTHGAAGPSSSSSSSSTHHKHPIKKPIASPLHDKNASHKQHQHKQHKEKNRPGFEGRKKSNGEFLTSRHK